MLINQRTFQAILRRNFNGFLCIYPLENEFFMAIFQNLQLQIDLENFPLLAAPEIT